ncbi:MAG: zinc ribbon domain-containing protein [Acidobacteria bacterium]|nr:zinc ribbon domain-containing protein [Acidobacteriota bacterium]
MFCHNCGAATTPGQKFCIRCGTTLEVTANPPAQAAPTPAVVAPLPPVERRIEKHAKILAILWLAASGLRLLPGLGLLFFGGGMAMHFIPFPIRALLLPFVGVVGALLLAGAVAGLVAGWGLLNYRPWARVLALILGAISLIHFPFGTALGIYTLWVLLPTASEREYQRLAHTTF